MKETFEKGGCIWEVVKRYHLSDEYMKAHDLYYKNRIIIRCIKSNGVIPVWHTLDYADTTPGRAV